ncbi:DeoR/GlpR family DNA-binding transcription regulator [Aerococcaceae bacterium 50-4]
MLKEERKDIISKQLQLKKRLTYQKIADYTNVSVDTVRRDLKEMEEEGKLQVVRGGATLPNEVANLVQFSKRNVLNTELKRKVAKKALNYIKEGDVVALNSGTTNVILAQEIANSMENITIVTNNLAAATVLMSQSNLQVIIIGGQTDNKEFSTYGLDVEKEFMRYHPDIAFLAMNAVDEEFAYSDFRLNEMSVINCLARISHQVIAVMDMTKMNTQSQRQVLPLDAVDKLVTNDLEESIKLQYEKAGVVFG